MTGSHDGTAKVWHLSAPVEPTDSCTLPHDGTVVESVAFSSDDTRILTTASDHKARMWNVRTGQLLAEAEHRDA